MLAYGDEDEILPENGGRRTNPWLKPDWSPDQAVSLWDVCHTTDPSMAAPYVQPQGTRGMYQVGECCTEDGHVWKCTQADTSYPPSQLPGSWTDLGVVEEGQD